MTLAISPPRFRSTIESEGGTGIWQRLAIQPDGFSEVARKALDLCHFDPKTGGNLDKDETTCAAACYECLLTYSNQLHHRNIDRRVLKQFLFAMISGTTRQTHLRDREAQYNKLLGSVDPAPPPGAGFHKLPQRSQCTPAGQSSNPPSSRPHGPTGLLLRQGQHPWSLYFRRWASSRSPQPKD